jgi:ABC-type glycerol-3-phosphate transport system substrate-binding protein
MKTKFVNFVLVGCCLWISAKAQGQTQLKFWLNSSLGAHEKAAYQKAADEYSQKNPAVKITVEAVRVGRQLL